MLKFVEKFTEFSTIWLYINYAIKRHLTTGMFNKTCLLRMLLISPHLTVSISFFSKEYYGGTGDNTWWKLIRCCDIQTCMYKQLHVNRIKADTSQS